ncbi:hypothetical protein Y032_0010g1091 [Ancylostoma ceylanicum]|uniref:Uncharacterized protein n=1 Tax=Ancylostoma ceylanicum TaxID=53326 RepID=A0A016VHR3_9BILA|nr:hypothetical protein Y032_0010g1091 [Ancylostoma ceylanicum]
MISAKDDIRSLLRTDPSERMDIHTLMRTPLVTGEEEPLGVPIPGAEDEETDESSAAPPFPGVTLHTQPYQYTVVRLSTYLLLSLFLRKQPYPLQLVTEPIVVPRSVRFLRDGVKAPRLHSIQVRRSRSCPGHDAARQRPDLHEEPADVMQQPVRTTSHGSPQHSEGTMLIVPTRRQIALRILSVLYFAPLHSWMYRSGILEHSS